jgi:NADH-quinone oxidoreductase subunit G
MAKLVTLTIDGQTVSVPEGTLIVDAAKQIGIDIPVFCYHPKMEPVGMCRMCLVDIGRPAIDRATGQPVLDPSGAPKLQFGPKLETACTTPVSEGMVVIGLSDKVQAGRKEILEFLLTSHPLDCPVCDKGGECPLQNLTLGFGPGQSRFPFDDKQRQPKHLPLGELIFLDRERCIQCARCVRFQADIAGEPVLGFYQRGRATDIVTFSEPGFDSIFSGNTTDICPVGALTTADFRFGARPWEMQATASLCPQCPVGCNIVFNVRRSAKRGEVVIKRVLPRQNEAVNELWICDKGRFTAHHYAESPARLTQPLVRRSGELQPASWDEALQLVGASFKDAGRDLLTLASGRLSNEDLYNLHALSAALKSRLALDTEMGGGDLVAQVGLGQDSNLADLKAGSVILVVAADLHETAPLWWLRLRQAAKRGATLIVASPRPTPLERVAKHVLRYPYGSETQLVLALANASQPTLQVAGLKAAAEAFKQAENAMIFFGNEGLGLAESQALAQACAYLLSSAHHTGQPNNGLVGVWPRPNDQGAWELGLRPLPDLRAAIAEAKALYIVGADPVGDDPALAEVLKNVGHVVVQELFLTETAKLADVVLPALPYTARDGSYTSGERRVQRFYPAFTPPPAGARADFAITAQLAKLLGLELEGRSAARVLAQMAAKLPAYVGIDYRKLAQTAPQWPIVGRGDLYYGGAAHANTQGLGLQLALVGRSQAAPAASAQAAPAPATLLGVPVTRLYDRGQTMLPAAVLAQRTPAPYIALHPEEARRQKVFGYALVRVRLNGTEQVVELRLDESLPAGLALVPRSLGLPIHGPTPLEISPAERRNA